VRIRISQEIAYTYDSPARSVMHALRVMPRDHEGQVVVSWRIEPSVDGRLRAGEDPFGNLVHHFEADGPFDQLAIRIDGIVETTDTTGFVRGAAELLPPPMFLRQSKLTHPDEPMILYARRLARAGVSPLQQLHGLMDALHTEMTIEPGRNDEPAKACDAFSLRRGSPIDIAHVFCGCARELGVPSRLVAGYLAVPEGGSALAARHAWVEAWVDGYGWIGFDACLNLCPVDAHVRVATGIDHADAAPFRVSRVGGAGERASNALRVAAVDQ
jgi:transglutaminase-like putative cysteine protease